VTPTEAPTGIRILTRMGIPIFLQPAHVVQQGRIEGLAVRQGRLTFQVKNSGNVHFMEQAVRVRGVGGNDDSRFDHQEAGWYVLAGAARTRELALPPEACASIRTLAVEVRMEKAALQERLDVPPDTCTP